MPPPTLSGIRFAGRPQSRTAILVRLGTRRGRAPVHDRQLGPSGVFWARTIAGIWSSSRDMPSLVRFLVVVGIIGAAVVGGLYVMAVFFEPAQRETATPLPGVKVRR